MERMLYQSLNRFELDVAALIRMAVWCGLPLNEIRDVVPADAIQAEIIRNLQPSASAVNWAA